MAAYLIAEHIITDSAKFEEYRTKVGPMIAKHGGRCSQRVEPTSYPRAAIGIRSGS